MYNKIYDILKFIIQKYKKMSATSSLSQGNFLGGFGVFIGSHVVGLYDWAIM